MESPLPSTTEPSLDATTPETKRRTIRWLWAVGLGLTALAGILILHFAISYALAGFPSDALTSAKNWGTIGFHAFTGLIGLSLVMWSRR